MPSRRPGGGLHDVERAIARAKDAAMKAGLGQESSGQLPVFRTSYALRLHNLDHAALIRDIENEISQHGAEATIVYSTHTCWVTAPSTLSPEVIIGIFAQYGVEAELTQASERRQASLQENYERRYRHTQYRHSSGLILGHLRRDREEEDEEEIRESGFLNRARTIKEQEPTEVLFTARALLTLRRLIISLIFAIPVLAICYIGAWQFPYWQWVCLALTAPVVFWGAWPFHRAALGGVRRGLSALDAASSVAVLAAYFWSGASLILTHAGDRDWHFKAEWFAMRYARLSNGELFLDVACGITVLLLFGRLMSRRTTHKGLLTELEETSKKVAPTATVVRKSPTGVGSIEVIVPKQEIRVGDDVIISAGNIIPADGEVIGGKSTAISGAIKHTRDGSYEVKVGSHVYAGTTNRDADIKIRVIRTGSRTRIAAMKRWVLRATHSDNRDARMAIRSASYLVPGTITLAVIAFGLWWFLSNNANTAVACALAMLACVCPVALALSTSLTLRLAIEQAARNGVFLRNTQLLPALDTATTVIFNRVGTLTEEDMAVKSVMARQGENPDLILRVAAALAMESDHPVSRALVRADREARDKGTGSDHIPHWIDVSNAYIDEYGSFSGLVEIPVAIDDDPTHEQETMQVSAKLWRPRDLSEVDEALVNAVVSGGTPLIVSWKNKARGVITLQDKNKPDALDSVAALENLGLETIMLTRDTYPVARRFADDLGISRVLAGIAPAKKAATVRSVHAAGDQVILVGDRSVADCLKVADIGILLGSTEDLDCKEADIVILSDNVMSIANLVILARRVSRLARRNMIFTWAYNGTALALAAFGVLHPMAATLVMVLASLIVEFSATRVRRF